MKGMQEVTRKFESWFDIDGQQDAVDILKADHRKVEGLFQQFYAARSSDRKQQLLNQIIQELSIHATVEEDLVYPLLEGQRKTADKTKEAEEEHHLLKMALSELSDMPISSNVLKPKVRVVEELVKHHVKEEESNLLPQLKRNGLDLDHLANEIRGRKEKLMRAISRGGGVGQKKAQRKQLATTSRKTATKKSGAAAEKRQSTPSSTQRKASGKRTSAASTAKYKTSTKRNARGTRNAANAGSKRSSNKRRSAA